MSFAIKQAEVILGVDLDGDGIIGSIRGLHPQGQVGLAGVMMNQMERMTGMDLNGDGRIGGWMGQPQQYNQFGGPSSQGFAQYSTSSTFQTGPQFGGHGFAQYPLQGGGSMLNQMERMTGVDLNGDGRIGGLGQGYLFNQHSFGF